MGGLSIWHWLIVGAVMLLVFGGKGKISDIMGDVAKGIKSFKKGLAEEDQKPEVERPGDPPMRTIDHQTAADPAKIPASTEISDTVLRAVAPHWPRKNWWGTPIANDNAIALAA